MPRSVYIHKKRPTLQVGQAVTRNGNRYNLNTTSILTRDEVMPRNKRALLNTEADWIVVSASGTHIGHGSSSRVNRILTCAIR